MKEVLLKLATTYTVRNQIKGLIPGSPMPGAAAGNTDDGDDESVDDEVGAKSRRGLQSWQSQALEKIRSIEGRRNKFKLFCKDQVLERIRYDSRLNHAPISIADSSAKKKKAAAPKPSGSAKSNEEGNEESKTEKEGKEDNNEETSEEKKKSVRKHSSPRCALCVGLMGSAKAYQTVYSCRTCGVYLCVGTHGTNKKSCFEKWHSVKCLGSLLKDNSVNAGVKQPVRKSPRKKAKSSAEEQTGSINTERGLRRSTRKRSAPPTDGVEC